MLIGIMTGQRTPGHSTAEAVAFENRIHQRYVDYIAEDGWDYLGVYVVDGLVPGAFGEVVVVDAATGGDAIARNAEHEKRDMPEDVAAFYRECSALFWTRGGAAMWLSPAEGTVLPRRGDTVRLSACAAGSPGAVTAQPWREGSTPPVEAVRMEIISGPVVAADDELLAEDVPALPVSWPHAAELVFRPLVVAPERSAGDAQAG